MQQPNERTRSRQTLVPHADIYETQESIVLLVDLPGVKKDDVHVTLEHDVLTIEGTSENPILEGLKLAHRAYVQAAYRRSFTLSTDVDREAISATVRDGVLTLVLPKAATMRSRRIDVQAA